MQRSELIGRMRESHERLARALDGLSEEQATRKGLNPQWSVKDCLAHIAAWEIEGTNIVKAMAGGKWVPQEMDMSLINKYNARAIEQRVNNSMREVTDEFNAART
ncbi:MAG TPA: maleylpyruvate isomerase N-terminal domain-containing protein, partial [Pyrinomonadaceae bacterium]